MTNPGWWLRRLHVAISRGRVPSPSTPSTSSSRLNWALAPVRVPVAFRRSDTSYLISKRSNLQRCWSEHRWTMGELTFEPRTEEAGVQIPSPPPPARTSTTRRMLSSGCAAQRTKPPYCTGSSHECTAPPWTISGRAESERRSFIRYGSCGAGEAGGAAYCAGCTEDRFREDIGPSRSWRLRSLVAWNDQSVTALPSGSQRRVELTSWPAPANSCPMGTTASAR
jgi:hypothetical protein